MVKLIKDGEVVRTDSYPSSLRKNWPDSEVDVNKSGSSRSD